jgi:diguanylate cyclase (GGDEF)-like protein
VAADLTDEAFVASLLSHIGMLAINVIAPQEYEKVLSAARFEGGSVADWEQQILGFTHADCGAELARLWRLPEDLVLCVQHHDDLEGFAGDDERTGHLVHLVHVASLIGHCFLGSDKTESLNKATAFASDTWGMDCEQLDLLLNDIHKDVETAADLFEVSVDDPGSYDQILQAANAEMARLLMTAEEPGAPGQSQSEMQRLQDERAALQVRAERLEKMAYRDGLTGLYNLRALTEQLERLFAQARSSREPLGVIFIDTDGFKQINDTLGHDVANEVLCDLAALITGELRSTDVLCRFGGDEFAVLLPGSDAKDVQGVAERLRHASAENTFRTPAGTARATLSIGAAVYDGAAGYPNAEALLKAADTAMYQSKRKGKNRVTITEQARARR